MKGNPQVGQFPDPPALFRHSLTLRQMSYGAELNILIGGLGKSGTWILDPGTWPLATRQAVEKALPYLTGTSAVQERGQE